MHWLTEKAPERIAGSPDERAAARYLQQQLASYGLTSQLDIFDGYLSFPMGAELQVLSPEEKTIACRVCCHIAATPPAGIQAELLYVGAGGVADYRDTLDRRPDSLAAQAIGMARSVLRNLDSLR